MLVNEYDVSTFRLVRSFQLLTMYGAASSIAYFPMWFLFCGFGFYFVDGLFSFNLFQRIFIKHNDKSYLALPLLFCLKLNIHFERAKESL